MDRGCRLLRRRGALPGRGAAPVQQPRPNYVRRRTAFADDAPVYETLAHTAPAAVACRTAGAQLATGDEVKRLKLADGAYFGVADQVIRDERGRRSNCCESLRIPAVEPVHRGARAEAFSRAETE